MSISANVLRMLALHYAWVHTPRGRSVITDW